MENLVKKLQKEAKQFLTGAKLLFRNVEIIPKEIEVYFYKEGVFPDNSVHQKKYQTKEYKNHFYVHRCKKSDSYKGGNRAGLDFVVSDETDTYYSYLIRSAVINGKTIYGPNNVLNTIKELCGNISYEEIEKQVVELKASNVEYDYVVFTTRYKLGKDVDEYFRSRKLRLVLLDNLFKESKYKAKEDIVLDFFKQTNYQKKQAFDYCKSHMSYVPSKVKDYYEQNDHDSSR